MKQFVHIRSIIILAILGAFTCGLLAWLFNFSYYIAAAGWIVWMAFILWVFHD